MAKIVELREMGDDKIEELLENAREEIFNLRFQHASARLDDVSRLRAVRREIAQFETVLHMRQLAIKEAVKQADVADALSGKAWTAEAQYIYEDNGWNVSFFDDNDDEIVSAIVDLNRKKSKKKRRK